MIRVEAERGFDVSAEEGFAYIADPERWPEYWPGLVRVQPGSQWRQPGDRARLVMRLLGREVELALLLKRIEPGRLVEYESVQAGLPDARHERRFEPDGRGFRYRLAVEYEPRPGLRGIADRLLLRRAVARALEQTLGNLAGRLPADRRG